jgi:hypothetical protein
MSVNNLKVQVAGILPLNPSSVFLTTMLDPFIGVQFGKFSKSVKEMKIKIISNISKCCCLGMSKHTSVPARQKRE